MSKERCLSKIAILAMAAAIVCILWMPGGRADAQTATPFSVWYDFDTVLNQPNDGSNPPGSFTRLGTTLYGMTTWGGYPNGYNGFPMGVIFKFDTTNNTFSRLHYFGGVQDDAGHPYLSSFILSGSKLYGMTQWGGANLGDYHDYGMGTIFKYDTTVPNTPPTVLHSFAGSPDGTASYGDLTLVGTTLYGMTYGGGDSGKGTIFKCDTMDGSNYKLLYSFNGQPNDGSNPLKGPLTAVKTVLYGMTATGGVNIDTQNYPNGMGTIFKFDTAAATKPPAILHHFGSGSNNGIYPYGSLVVSGATLYGVTYAGGANTISDGMGTIFSCDLKGGSFKVLHSFAGGPNDGSHPIGDPILSGKILYGTTYQGGANNLGTVYMFDTQKHTFTLLHSFAGVDDGSHLFCSLTLIGTTLYGMAKEGGTTNYGTIFSLPSLPLATISGKVTGANGVATVTVSKPPWSSQGHTDVSSGNYSMGNLLPGKYTATPSMDGYVFSPKNLTATLNGNNATTNFTATPVTISGTVTPYKGPCWAVRRILLSN